MGKYRRDKYGLADITGLNNTDSKQLVEENALIVLNTMKKKGVEQLKLEAPYPRVLGRLGWEFIKEVAIKENRLFFFVKEDSYYYPYSIWTNTPQRIWECNRCVNDVFVRIMEILKDKEEEKFDEYGLYNLNYNKELLAQVSCLNENCKIVAKLLKDKGIKEEYELKTPIDILMPGEFATEKILKVRIHEYDDFIDFYSNKRNNWLFYWISSKFSANDVFIEIIKELKEINKGNLESPDKNITFAKTKKENTMEENIKNFEHWQTLDNEEIEEIGNFIGWLKLFDKNAECSAGISNTRIVIDVKRFEVFDKLLENNMKVIIDKAIDRIFGDKILDLKIEENCYSILLKRKKEPMGDKID